MADMLIIALPMLVKVTGTDELDKPILIPPELIEDGLKLATGAWPVPLNGPRSGLLEALVVKVKLASLEPTAKGLKVTPTTQFAPWAREAPQVLLEIA